jgi:SAM-dependent methyltransferase
MGEDYYQRLIALGIEAVSDMNSPHIIDVGCGPGRLTADLARRIPSALCTAIDPAGAMIDLARRILLLPAGTLIAADARNYGFPVANISAHGLTNVRVCQEALEDQVARGRRYDLVLASHLLDRVPSSMRSLRDLLSLVAPRGSILLSCAFNFVSRNQWTGPKSGEDICEVLGQHEFDVDYFDEAYPYRELQDARGTWTEHRVAIIRAVRHHRSS